MNRFLKNLFGYSTKTSAPEATRRQNRSVSLCVEGLEQRQLMSTSPIMPPVANYSVGVVAPMSVATQVATKLLGDIDGHANRVAVENSSIFPTAPFDFQIDAERLTCKSIVAYLPGTTGAVWEVQRGVNNTPVQIHSAGSTVTLFNPTTNGLKAHLNISDSDSVIDPVTGMKALLLTSHREIALPTTDLGEISKLVSVESVPL